MNNDIDFRFQNINTITSRQQNPFQVLEYPADKEYIRMPLGAINYLLLMDYPTDIEVYISLNSAEENKIKLDVRNTGFKVSELFSPQGMPAIIENVYLWTKGISSMVDSNGNPALIRIITSGITQIEMLYNASISALEQIGQIGRLGLVEAINKLTEVMNVKNVDSVTEVKNQYKTFPPYAVVGSIGNSTGAYYITPAQAVNPQYYGHLIRISKKAALQVVDLGGEFIQTHLHISTVATSNTNGSDEAIMIKLGKKIQNYAYTLLLSNCNSYLFNQVSNAETAAMRSFMMSQHFATSTHQDYECQWRPQDLCDMEAIRQDDSIAEDDIIFTIMVATGSGTTWNSARAVMWVNNHPEIKFENNQDGIK